MNRAVTIDCPENVRLCLNLPLEQLGGPQHAVAFPDDRGLVMTAARAQYAIVVRLRMNGI